MCVCGGGYGGRGEGRGGRERPPFFPILLAAFLASFFWREGCSVRTPGLGWMEETEVWYGRAPAYLPISSRVRVGKICARPHFPPQESDRQFVKSLPFVVLRAWPVMNFSWMQH